MLVRFLDRLAALGLAGSWLTLLSNLAFFRRPSGALPTHAPRVSVLVPARNEEANIERCVRSLLAQDYPDFEVIVLDDHSTDGTAQILTRIKAEHEQGRVQDSINRSKSEIPRAPTSSHELPSNRKSKIKNPKSTPLPPNWVGKNWACWQLAQAADLTSRYLLFTDADTWHAPDALRRSVAEAECGRLALLSLMPEQVMETWGEKAVVGLLALQIIGFLPLAVMAWLPLPRIASANGQYMLFERGAYERIGGHAAHAGQLAEDVLLARRVRQFGGRVRLMNGAGVVSCRMYRSAAEAIAGFRRSFASGFRLDGPLAAGIVVTNFNAFLWPFLRLRTPQGRVMALLALAERWLLARLTRSPAAAVALHPLGIALLIASQLLAAWDALTNRATSWKGRAYDEH